MSSRPALSDGRKRPVMVWLHGGGFSSGSGSGRILDGTSLAQTHDVVVVTLNHRLNVFGYTYLGDAMGSDFALSSSVGLLDIVAALQWVRDNIAASAAIRISSRSSASPAAVERSPR